MVKLIFYGCERDMLRISFVKLLKEKTHLGLKASKDVMDMIVYGETSELVIEDDEIANEIYDKSREYKVLVRKEIL